VYAAGFAFVEEFNLKSKPGSGLISGSGITSGSIKINSSQYGEFRERG
jgi:hypothetical protein